MPSTSAVTLMSSNCIGRTKLQMNGRTSLIHLPNGRIRPLSQDLSLSGSRFYLLYPHRGRLGFAGHILVSRNSTNAVVLPQSRGCMARSGGETVGRLFHLSSREIQRSTSTQQSAVQSSPGGSDVPSRSLLARPWVQRVRPSRRCFPLA